MYYRNFMRASMYLEKYIYYLKLKNQKVEKSIYELTIDCFKKTTLKDKSEIYIKMMEEDYGR